MPDLSAPEGPRLSRRSMMALTGLGAAAGALAAGGLAPPTACAAESLRARFHMTPPHGWLCDG